MPEVFRVASLLLSGIRGLYQLPDSVRHPFKRELQFTMQQQIMTQWCWAASACSVSHFYDGSLCILQSELVALHFCLDPTEEPDESWNLAAPIINGLQIVGCKPIRHSGQVSFRDVLKQLDRGNPVCAQIRWRDIDGNYTEDRHAVVITACWLDESDCTFYLVGDPGEGDLEECSESKLQESYFATDDWPGGRWEETFLVKKP